MTRRNEAVADLLEEIAELLTLKGDDPYRVRAYEEAALAIRATDRDIEELHRAGRLQDIRGVGKSIAAKVGEYLDSGRSRYREQLRREVRSPATGRR
jgi:DNA polymerase (family X)